MAENHPSCYLCGKEIEHGLVTIVAAGFLEAKFHDTCLIDPKNWKEKVEHFLLGLIQIKT